MRQNPLVVMCLHLGLLQLYGDQPGKQLLQDTMNPKCYYRNG